MVFIALGLQRVNQLAGVDEELKEQVTAYRDEIESCLEGSAFSENQIAQFVCTVFENELGEPDSPGGVQVIQDGSSNSFHSAVDLENVLVDSAEDDEPNVNDNSNEPPSLASSHKVGMSVPRLQINTLVQSQDERAQETDKSSTCPVLTTLVEQDYSSDIMNFGHINTTEQNETSEDQGDATSRMQRMLIMSDEQSISIRSLKEPTEYTPAAAREEAKGGAVVVESSREAASPTVIG